MKAHYVLMAVMSLVVCGFAIAGTIVNWLYRIGGSDTKNNRISLWDFTITGQNTSREYDLDGAFVLAATCQNWVNFMKVASIFAVMTCVTSFLAFLGFVINIAGSKAPLGFVLAGCTIIFSVVTWSLVTVARNHELCPDSSGKYKHLDVNDHNDIGFGFYYGWYYFLIPWIVYVVCFALAALMQLCGGDGKQEKNLDAEESKVANEGQTNPLVPQTESARPSETPAKADTEEDAAGEDNPRQLKAEDAKKLAQLEGDDRQRIGAEERKATRKLVEMEEEEERDNVTEEQRKAVNELMVDFSEPLDAVLVPSTGVADDSAEKAQRDEEERQDLTAKERKAADELLRTEQDERDKVVEEERKTADDRVLLEQQQVEVEEQQRKHSEERQHLSDSEGAGAEQLRSLEEEEFEGITEEARQAETGLREHEKQVEAEKQAQMEAQMRMHEDERQGVEEKEREAAEKQAETEEEERRKIVKEERKSAKGIVEEEELAKRLNEKDVQRRRALWADIKPQLPSEKHSAEQLRQRFDLFKEFDRGSKKYLTPSDLDYGFRSRLGMGQLGKGLSQVLPMAHAKARAVHKTKGIDKKQDDENVERCEFRLVFVNVKKLFDLWFMFDTMDVENSGAISEAEFRSGLPQLKEWGKDVEDPEAEFAAADKAGTRKISFEEFCDYATANELQEDVDDTDNDENPDEEDPEEAQKRNAAAVERRRRIWDDLSHRLPTNRKSKEERHRRFAYFREFDNNSKGYLTLPEVEHGCHDVLGLGQLGKGLHQVLPLAFSSACGKANVQNQSAEASRNLEKSEMRLLFVYIHWYFDLFFMFDNWDTDDSGGINRSEFIAGVPEVEKWAGVKIWDANAEFDAVDADKTDFITFAQFCDWAEKKNANEL